MSGSDTTTRSGEELVGRHEACSRIEQLLEGARRGQGGTLALRGEPGIGKSALLAHALDRAADMEVLGFAAVAAEADLPFGALHALLLPRLALLDGLPANQARALRSALAIGPEDAGDRLAAYAGTLGLLAQAAATQPLLVAVDDAQWLDPDSREALVFAARRLERSGVAFLLTTTEGGLAGDELAVERLGDETARALLRARWPELAPAVACVMLAEAAGNPLALTTLPALLSADQRAGRLPIASPPPVPAPLGRAFLAAVAGLPLETRLALIVAAAGEGADLAAVKRAAGALGCPPRAFEPAEAAGLIAVVDGSLAFLHPLVRSAVYHDAGTVQRRAAHRALAAELEGAGRAWQLAAAAEGPDEQAAAALETAAGRLGACDGDATRWRLLERAVELSAGAGARVRRSVAASRAACCAGQPERALELVDAALPLAADPLVRADLRLQQALAAVAQGKSFPEAAVAAEARRIAPLDGERTAALLGLVLERRVAALDLGRSQALSTERFELCAGASPEWRLRTLGDLVRTHAIRGEAEAALELLPELLADPERAADQALALVWLERHDDARAALEVALERANACGASPDVARHRTGAAMLELAAGRVAEALTAASQACSIAERLRRDDLIAPALPALAYIEAIRGREEACREHAGRAERLGARLEDGRVRAGARIALGVLALGTGAPAEAIALLAPVARTIRRHGIGEPGVLPCEPDLIEAYARLGEVEQARALLDAFSRRARAVGRGWALAAAARCAGLLADDAEFGPCFEEALELGERSAARFEHARTQLYYGERLRRSNRRREARGHLRAALEAFEEDGATPWAERARNELRATGQTVPRLDGSVVAPLTPQELQIARLVATSNSNRRVGELLFVSRKTVEYHLAHVYRKLDVHSRVELARRFTAGPEPAASRSASLAAA